MNELKALRVTKKIPARDMVEVVQKIYPKYDKTMQSKCENGELYGIELSRDAMDALYEKFDQERASAIRARRKDKHRLTCSIRARLEKPVYDALQRRIEAEGYATAQDWLTDKVMMYLDAYGDLDDLDKEGAP